MMHKNIFMLHLGGLISPQMGLISPQMGLISPQVGLISPQVGQNEPFAPTLLPAPGGGGSWAEHGAECGMLVTVAATLRPPQGCSSAIRLGHGSAQCWATGTKPSSRASRTRSQGCSGGMGGIAALESRWELGEMLPAGAPASSPRLAGSSGGGGGLRGCHDNQASTNSRVIYLRFCFG